jgi:Cu(I)/Ag(I) efflux system membrane protein CusA/SilA
MRFLLKIYDPTLNWALNHRKTVIARRSAVARDALLGAFGLPRAWVKRRFAMQAGSRWRFGHRLRQGIHAAAQRRQPALHAGDDAEDRSQGNPARHVVAGQGHAATPEIETVAGKLGRFETATDPAPTEMLETTIMLKPEWIPTNRCLASSSCRA